MVNYKTISHISAEKVKGARPDSNLQPFDRGEREGGSNH